MAFVVGGTGLVVASLLTDPPAPDEIVLPQDNAVTQPPAVPVPAPQVAVVPDPPVALPPEVPAPPVPEVETDLAIVMPPPEPEPEPAFEPALEPEPAPEMMQPDPPSPLVETAPAPQVRPTVRVNRPGATPAPDPVEELVPETTPLVLYAADYDYAADLPLVAVVLRDDPSVADAPALIAGLPFVPTMVLNASAPDVTARMRAYRAIGVEVMFEALLPQGAQPSDVEITYQTALDLVPEAVAVFADGTGPESSGAVADQVMQWIAAEGRGYVTVPRGLGAMRPMTPGDVPVALITRDVDGLDETQAAVERNLAQASFRARQTGQAVVLARATPATLEAIRIWANRSDPGQVSLVPVSAMLIAQLPPP